MTDDLRPLPPPVLPSVGPGVPSPPRLPHPAALFAVASVLGIAAAIIVGVAAGALVTAAGSSNCTPSDGWCDLGAAIFGVLVGIAIGAITYLVVGVMTIFRCRPSGHRSTHVLAHVVLPISLFALMSVVGAIVP